MRKAIPQRRRKRRGPQALGPGLFAHLERYVLMCFERESPPRVSELAGQLELPLRSFIETFHRTTGMTPSTYLKERQVAAARMLLLKTRMSVDRVGYAAAFGTRRTFFREFQHRVGMSPGRYRKSSRIVSKS